MDILRRMAVALLSPLFIFLLFATAFDIGFVRTATHPDTVKQLVSESGIYNSVVPSILQQTKTIETPLGNFSTTDPSVQKAASQAISPQDIQRQTGAAIDNIYQWLDGKVAQPTFKFDLTGPNSNFANNVSSAVQQRLAGLPTCSTTQSLQILQNGQVDVNSLNCVPKGVSAQSLANQVNTALASSGFLGNVNLDASSFKGSNNQSFFQSNQAKQAPKWYQRVKKTPLILSILTILTGLGIVFLSKTWQHGLRHVGINLVVIGLVMLAFAWALNRTVNTKIAPKIKVDNAVLQTDIRKLVTDVGQQIDKNYWFFGGFYTVLGAGSITAAEIFRRRSPPLKAAIKDQGAPEMEAPREPEAKRKT